MIIFLCIVNVVNTLTDALFEIIFKMFYLLLFFFQVLNDAKTLYQVTALSV